jgi:hypothetical protein
VLMSNQPSSIGVSIENAVVLPCSLKRGPRPVFAELEIKLAQWVEQQASLKLRVSRLSVIKQALEFCPNMYGGINDPEYMVKARRWYYRFKDRHGFSIRVITSRGQKKPIGWEGKWRASLQKFHNEVRTDPVILEKYNRCHPQAHVTILPICECGDSDQTPDQTPGQKQKRQRQVFNAQQIAVLSMEEQNSVTGQGRASNRDIAGRINGLDGGRSVTGDDVARWFRNAHAKRHMTSSF